jgi:hypothetical protein
MVSGGSGLLLAFGVRFSLTRLQELFCMASNRSPAAALQRITTDVFDSSSLPLILVVSDTEFSGGEYSSGVEGKRGKLPELVTVPSQPEISHHAEVAVVLHVLHLAGLRAAQSLHQLQRDIQRINRGMMIEPIRNDNHFSLLVQIASSHGVHFIVALLHGKEMKNKISNNMEPAVRVFLPSFFSTTLHSTTLAHSDRFEISSQRTKKLFHFRCCLLISSLVNRI